MLYQLGVLLALLSCICAGVCLFSIFILAICHTFNLAFVEFSIHNELHELNTSIESSLPWLVHLIAALATGTINSIRSTFSRVSFKSNPNYAKIIAQKDEELAQLRETIFHQAARIELLEIGNVTVVEADTPPADPLIAQQAAEIAAKDARISSLTDTTVRQADVEAQLREKLADKEAKIEDQEARIALISGDMCYLEDQVKRLEGEKHEAFATAKSEGITAQVQEAQEARAVAEEGRTRAQDRLVGYEELLENAAFDVREMQSKVAESKKIDPYIYRQTVQQVHSLHAERDEARVARDTAIKESFEAKIVESETMKSMTALLKELKSAIDDKEIAEGKFSELEYKLNKDVQTAEDKVRAWEIKYSEKANDVAKTQRASSNKEANLRNEMIRANIKGHSMVASAQAKVLSLENQVELLQANNELLNEQLQQSKSQLRHARYAKQPILEQAKAQASSGQSAEELQAYNHTLTIRLQELEETAEKDKQVLRTSLQSKIDELHMAHTELQQRHIPSAVVPSQDTGIDLQEELEKQRTELEGACRRILADKETETQSRVDAVIQERNKMEQKLRKEMTQSENNLKELANKLWDEKRAELDMQIEQASDIITNLRNDLEKLEDEKKTAIEKVETDYEYLLLDVDRLNEEVGNLKQAAKDRDANFEPAKTGKRPIDGEIAMTLEPTSTTSNEPAKPTSAFGQPSPLPPFGAASQQSVPFTFGANAEIVPATKPLYSGTAAGKKPANGLLSFDDAGNALADHPPLFRATAGNQPAAYLFSFGAVDGNQPAIDPFSFGAFAGNQPATDPFSFGAVAENQPATDPFLFGAVAENHLAADPFSFGAVAENQPAADPFSFGAVAGNQPADNTFSFGAVDGNQPADNTFSFGAVAGNQPATDPFSFGAFAGNQPATDPFSFGAVAENHPAADPFSFGAVAENHPAADPFSFGAVAENHPAADPFSFGAVAGNQPADDTFSFDAVARNQPAADPFSFGAIAGDQPATDPFSFGAIATNPPVNKPFTFGALGKKTPANNPLPCAVSVEEPKANEPPSFGSPAEGSQVDRSKPASAQQPAPNPAKPTETPPSPAKPVTLAEAPPPAETVQGEKASTPTTTSPSTQPPKSALPNSSATASSTAPSIPQKKPTPSTATVTAAQAGGKAIALAAAAKIKADKAIALEARRASDVREEFARNTQNELADQLLEQLQGSNETLQKITKVVKSGGRMARVEDIHEILCTCPIPNEKSFDNVDSSEWPVLHTQLKDIQVVFDDLDRILEDCEQLRWEDLLALLTKPRHHDPVETAPTTGSAGNSTPAYTPGNGVALPGLYPDGNIPATPRVIRPMPRSRRGPHKLVVPRVD
ncbi:hypothetical protein N7G274_006805 [Stereocaulon virgatum]|uniref:Uncharacterized protein n=1 Tax=Stereocaulon virgatum TaxID=373712 RepID=A0ABR4A355_9LECA